MRVINLIGWELGGYKDVGVAEKNVGGYNLVNALLELSSWSGSIISANRLSSPY